MFGDSSDEDDNLSTIQSLFKQDLNDLFIQLMRIKPSLKRSNEIETVLLNRSFLIILPNTMNSDDSAELKLFQERIKQSHFTHVTFVDSIESEIDNYDVVVVLSLITDIKLMFNIVGISGLLVLPYHLKIIETSNRNWYLNEKSENITNRFICYHKRDVRCNLQGVPYWTLHENYDIEREYRQIDEITIQLTNTERNLGIFSDQSRNHAIQCLNKHGICVFPGLFDPSVVSKWGKTCSNDMTSALNALLSKGIDLTHPSTCPRIENYYELSMREELRVDLRNGIKMKELHKLSNDSNPAFPNSTGLSIRNHPAINDILSSVMNPDELQGDYARGNWGRWNFEQGGPDKKPTIKVAEIGAVITLPGCVDQTIHADTSHIYTKTDLPGHYFNLFLIASSDKPTNNESEKFFQGQTAFILNSHHLEQSAKIMVDQGGQTILENHLIRPHLNIGDAVLMDCRLLHFGLSNQTSTEYIHNEDSWRILLYINHHHQWFNDPKNWNERDKLF